MKKISIILVSLLLLSIGFYLCACVANADNANRQINSINHRGYRDAPENTLAAFRLSKEKGFDMVECDVRFTKDNQAVLLHDSSVNRTSDGKGKIANLTLDEVKALDFGSWKNKSYAGEHIATFEEFVALCVELNLHPYVEVKSGATRVQVQILVDVVNQAKLSVTWISFDMNVLNYLVELHTDGRLGLLTHSISDSDVKFVVNLSKNTDAFIDANYIFLTPQDIKQCKKKGVPLEVWTINNQNVIANLDKYITGVTSDYLNAQSIFDNM